jgi:hypothetical protein
MPFPDMTTVPLMSDDYSDIAFQYETAAQMKRYREEVSNVHYFEL